MLKPGPDDLNFSRLSLRLTVVLLCHGYQELSQLSRLSDKELLSLERINPADIAEIRAEISRMEYERMLQ